MVRYTKEALDYAQQIRQLQGRGLAIVDPVKAELYLRKVGYYRLMGYLFPLRVAGSDTYLPGASIDTALRLYEFDCPGLILVDTSIGDDHPQRGL